VATPEGTQLKQSPFLVFDRSRLSRSNVMSQTKTYSPFFATSRTHWKRWGTMASSLQVVPHRLPLRECQRFGFTLSK
jgi:hypothetical protein